MALITFGPSGQTMNTDLTVASRGPITDPAHTIPQVSLEDKLVSGQLGAQVNDSGRNLIVWKDRGTESTRASWPMASAEAVEAGLLLIDTAHAADTAITLLPDGTGS